MRASNGDSLLAANWPALQQLSPSAQPRSLVPTGNESVASFSCSWEWVAVFDFTKTKDLQAFQKEMQDAYNYLTTQVAYLIEPCAQKVQRGLYGGGQLPAPYVIDRHLWKDERKPIIYRPWLEPTLTFFKKFHEYDFSLARIAAYN